jgi:hypothetical protein
MKEDLPRALTNSKGLIQLSDIHRKMKWMDAFVLHNLTSPHGTDK